MYSIMTGERGATKISSQIPKSAIPLLYNIRQCGNWTDLLISG